MIDVSKTSAQCFSKASDANQRMKLFKSLCNSPESLIGYASFSEEKYQRIRLAKSTEYELLLLCWLPGQSASFHDHGSSECLMSCLNGHLVETTSALGKAGCTQKQLLEAKEVRCLAGSDIHKVENCSDFGAISLHLYAPPINRCGIYCADLELVSEVDINPDEIKDSFTSENTD